MTMPNRIGVNKTKLKEPNITNNMTDVEFDTYCAKSYLSKIQSCKQRGIEFKLNFTSFKNLMRAKKCYYTGVTLTRGGGQENKPIYRDWETDRKSTRLNSSHSAKSRMPSSA